jgi:hypothetical protein
MTVAFADSFYYIALLNPFDRFHAAAIEATQTLDRHFVQAGFRALLLPSRVG